MTPTKLPYRLAPAPLGEGGFAQVFKAEPRDRPGGAVALKRARPGNVAEARLQREIDVQSRFDHPHIMPILDADPQGAWFVMPLAEGNLEQCLPTADPRSADPWS
jgi:serine/threonine protein kinase